MDAAYVHLLVNHFPVVLSVVGAGAALVALVTRHRTSWIVALVLLLLAGITAYPAVFTGSGAEDEMRRLWFVPRGTIHAHEEAGELAMWVLIATGLLSAWALFNERRAFTGGRGLVAAPAWLRALVTVGALASAGTVGYAAWQGGFIVHKSPLLRQPPAATQPAPPMPGAPTVTP